MRARRFFAIVRRYGACWGRPMLRPVARIASLALASLFGSISIAQSVDTEGSPPPLVTVTAGTGEDAASSGDEAATRLDPPSAPDRCHSSERNPEPAPIVDPTCNAYLIGRPRASGSGAKLAMAPLAIDPPSGAGPEGGAPAVASAKALARSPIALPRDARFS